MYGVLRVPERVVFAVVCDRGVLVWLAVGAGAVVG